jgi:cytochrome c-type biogenesis protein CcmE
VAVIDEPSGDEEGGGLAVDAPVTPRRPAKKGTALRVAVVLVVVVGAIAFLLWKGLGDSTTYFYNVDEAVERQDELGGDRFRMQGTVLDGTVEETDAGVTFTVEFDGVDADVVHQGDPPELFQPNLPVVVEGHWEGDTFASDRILVRHSSEYEAENEDRLDQAEDEADELQDAPAGSGETPSNQP